MIPVEPEDPINREVPPEAGQTNDPMINFVEEERLDLFDYARFSSRLRSLIGDWSQEKTKTDVRRQLRLVEVDVDSMREAGELEPDETFIPMRVIDENIKKEKPAYVSFITQANKLVDMTDKIQVTYSTDRGVNEFTKGMKYHGWELPWYREFDGAQLHGWDGLEVVFDDTKPLNTALEHIGHDRLLFAMDIQDIQTAPFCARIYTMTRIELKRMVSKFGFNQEQVRMLIEVKRRSSKEAGELVYKCYFKWEGQVYVSWLSLENGTNDWLKPPMPFYNGVRKKVMVEQPPVMQQMQTEFGMAMMPVPQPPIEDWQEENEEMYPIFLLRYDETEQLMITACRGRAFLDCHKQEAQTAIVTGFVNALVRASNVYASANNPDGSGILKYASDINLQHGRVLTNPVTFFHTDYPDATTTLAALQYFESRNANDLGQITEGLRKKKGEKTAYEYELAEQDKSLLSSVQLTLLSGHVREVYTYTWRIVRSQAQQGLIPFMVQSAMTGPDGTIKYVNDEDFLVREFDIRAAGDVEVIQKQQQIAMRKQDWPVVAQTPLAMVFLNDLIKKEYPNDAQRYEAILMQGADQGKQLVFAFRELVGELLKKYPQELTEATPEVKQQIATLEQAASAYIGDNTQQQSAGQPQTPPV